MGAALSVVAFAAMALSHLLSAHRRLWLLGASAVAFDLGIQAAPTLAGERRARDRSHEPSFVGPTRSSGPS